MSLDTTQIVILTVIVLLVIWCIIQIRYMYSVSKITSNTKERYGPLQIPTNIDTIRSMWGRVFSPNESVASKLYTMTVGKPTTGSLTGNSVGSAKKEGFSGGYTYFYDYPFTWPFFYSGCNSDVFNNITCLPIGAHPFW